MTGNQADNLMRNKPARKFHKGTNCKHVSVGPLLWDICPPPPSTILALLANHDQMQESLNTSSNNNSKTWQKP